MFNVLKFDNNNKINKHELRLITLNNSFDNKIYLYILLSIFKNKLNNFNADELNEISNEYKKLLNKHVKKNYSLKYFNLNIKKNKKINKENFNILSELLNLNITIFGKKELLLFKSSTEYKKSIYFLLKNNKLYLIAEKRNKSLSYQFKHKVLSGGAGNNKRAKVDVKNRPEENIGLWDPNSKDNWYSIEQVNDFLKKNCEICNSGTGEAFKAANEIIIATFTNINRERIYNIIRNINISFQQSIVGLNGILSGFLGLSYQDEIKSIVLVLSGGDAFNNLLNNENKRPVSPDIDCKLVINCESGIVLHDLKKNTYDKNINHNPEIFNIILLLVRNKLNDFLTVQTEELSQEIDTFNQNYQTITKNLYEYCIVLMDNVEGINYLRNKCGTNKILGSFKRRFVHMEAGIQAKDKPYRINNVLLYAIDCIYKYETSWTSIGGILDIVISIPGHTGYMLKENYDMVQNNVMGESYIYNMRKDYYIKEDNLKMVEYGLRTENKKIIKDFNRIILLLEEDNSLNRGMIEIKQKMLAKIQELKERADYGCFISTLEELENKITSLNREEILSGGGLVNNIYENIFCDKLKNREFNSNHFQMGELYNFNDDNINREEEYQNIEIQMNKLRELNRNNNRSRVMPIQQGGVNYNNNNNAVMDVKIPKALYYLFSDKITNFSGLSTYKKLKDGIMKPIKNFEFLREDIKGETEVYYKKIIRDLNYEKLTELTTKYPGSSKKELIEGSLRENLNSSALYRINNSLFSTWGRTTKGTPVNFSDKTAPYKSINKKQKISKFIFIKEKLLQEIINQININNDVIRELYFFDIPMNLFPLMIQDKLHYNKFINKEIAKCLLHTIMYPFCIEYIREQPMYYRFLGEKYITDDYNPSKGFNYEGYKENGYELPNDDVIQKSVLNIFLDFYKLINSIAVQNPAFIPPEEMEKELEKYNPNNKNNN